MSLSPHLADTHSSEMIAFLARNSDAHCRKSLAVREALAIVMMSPVPSMPKPATGLPVLSMPSTTRLVQPSSMPMTTTAATFGIGAGADQCAEEELEVLAELQPPIGVGQRHRALDVVGDRFGGRIGEIVERQDDDVVAHADAAVLAPPARKFIVPDAFALPFISLAMPTTAWS